MTTYYVDCQHSNAIDTNLGNDINSPLKTINAAAAKAIAGDTVLIREGTYRETVKSINSGSANQPITFKAFNSERVVVSGLEVIDTAWEVHQGEILKTAIPPAWNMGFARSQVFIDGFPMQPAIWPKMPILEECFITDYAVSTKGSYNTTPDSDGKYIGTYEDPNLQAIWAGANIRFLPGKAWVYRNGQIINSTAGRIDFKFEWMDSSYVPKPGNYYFLWGKLEVLTRSKEFFLDSTHLYLWPENGIVNKKVEIQARATAWLIDNKQYLEIDGIEFLACNIRADNCHNISFLNCKFYYGAHGLDGGLSAVVRLTGNYNSFINCDFNHTSRALLILEGDGCTVVNNTFSNSSMSHGLMVTSTNTPSLIESNSIFNMASHGIAAACKKSKIIRNRVFSIGNRVVDVAGINIAGSGDMQGMEIAYNLTHNHNALLDASREYWGANGIRLDSGFPEGVSNVSIHHNIIYASTGKSIVVWPLSVSHTNYGKAGNKVFNNSCQGVIRTPCEANHSLQGTTIQNNIAFSYESGTQEPIPSGVTLTNNILLYSSGANNLSVNPLFKNSYSFDYRLKAESPAINAGVNLGDVTPFQGLAPDIGALEYGDKPLVAGAYIWRESDLTGLTFKQSSENPSKLEITGLPIGRGFSKSAKFKVGSVQNLYHFNVANPLTGDIKTVVIFPDFTESLPNQSIEVLLDGVNSNGFYGTFRPINFNSPAIENVIVSYEDLSNSLRRYHFTVKGYGFKGAKTSRIPMGVIGLPPAYYSGNGEPRIVEYSNKPFLCKVSASDVQNISQKIGSYNGIRVNVKDENTNLSYWFDSPNPGIRAGVLFWIRGQHPFSLTQEYDEPCPLYVEFGEFDNASSFESVFPEFNSLNIKLWLKANDIEGADGSNVSVWNFAKEKGVSGAAVQTDVNKQPKLRLSSLGGLPAVEFDGVNDFMTAGNAFSKANDLSGSTFVVVYSNPEPGTTTNQRLISVSELGTKDFEVGIAMTAAIDSVTKIPVPQPNGYIQFWNAAKKDNSNLHIGIRHSSWINQFKGCISEIMAIGGFVSSFSSFPILKNDYFSAKYRIPNPQNPAPFQTYLDWDTFEGSIGLSANNLPCHISKVKADEITAYLDYPINSLPSQISFKSINSDGAIAKFICQIQN